MKLIMVTGLSGAGKSHALNTLEDLGYEAIDNIPLAFIPTLVDTVSDHRRKIAVGTDVRSRDFSEEVFKSTVDELRGRAGLEITTVFLDCSDEVLLRRFTETRRKHPLALDRAVMDGVRIERKMVRDLREYADIILDTTDYNNHDLKAVLRGHFGQGVGELSVFVSSFSFRKGLPRDADLVFDVRFLRNPHYDQQLKEYSGKNPQVGGYIEADPYFAPFFDNLSNMIVPLLPRYLSEGKSYLTICIGCTGGKHRSVFVAEKLAGFLLQNGYNVQVRHRDLEKSEP